MKKITASIISILIILMAIPMSALAASASFSGPSTVRAGDTINLTMNVSGGALDGYEGTLKYDSSLVTLTGVSNKAGGMTFSRNGNKIVAYDNSGNGTTASSIFVASFKVNNGVSAGSNIAISFSGGFSVNGTETPQTASYSVRTAAPLSSDATLSSLTVANAKLSPAFSPEKTSYSCGTVGFEVAKLSVSARANDSGARVSIMGSNLSVGDNNVKVVVTAANGARKTYTIKVTREQDPNYVPSSNVQLTGIELSSGQLSPEFTADTKEYVVYVPFETEVFSATAAAADPLAKGVENIEDVKLKVGLNKLSIKCTAEDGTEGLTKINVVRMTKFETEKNIVVPTEPVKTTKPAEKEESKKNGDGVSPILLGVLSVASLALGGAIGAVVMRRKYS